MISNIYKKTVVILLGILAGITGIMLLYGVSYSQKIYPFLYVGKTNVSNLSIDEAEKILREKIPEGLQVLDVWFGNQSFAVEASELEYDPKLTADKAYLVGREGKFLDNFKTKWSLWFSKKSLSFEYKLNSEVLEEQVDLLISQVSAPPIYYSLSQTPEGQIVVVPGKSGRVVNKNKLMKDIDKGLSNLDFSKIVVEASLIEVVVSQEELEKAQRRGELLKERVLSLKYGDGEKKIEGQGLIDLIDFKGGFDEEKVKKLMGLVSEEVNREPQNAVFRFEGGRVVEFKPAIDGLLVNEEISIIKVVDGLSRLETLNCKEVCETIIVNLEVEKSAPEVRISEVNNLGIVELIGKGESTFHGSIPSREHNVALTAYKLDGVLIKPGEVFSFNGSVGDISAATGYQSAYIIKDGRTVLGDGGGVCQDSTTMFRAALDAGLPIIERHPHAYRVSYYEPGSPVGIDATIYSPSTDFKFLNDTPAHILIQTNVNTVSNYLKIEIYGTSDGRVATIFSNNSSTPNPVLAETNDASDASIPRTSSICSLIFSGSDEGRSALFNTGKIS